MPMSPRAGSRRAYRHRKSWSSSSAEGALKLLTCTPWGLTPLMTCRMVPSLPPASRDWRQTSTPCVSFAASRAWYSASSSTPVCRRSAPSAFLTKLALYRGSKSRPRRTVVPGFTRRGRIDSAIRWALSSAIVVLRTPAPHAGPAQPGPPAACRPSPRADDAAPGAVRPPPVARSHGRGNLHCPRQRGPLDRLDEPLLVQGDHEGGLAGRKRTEGPGSRGSRARTGDRAQLVLAWVGSSSAKTSRSLSSCSWLRLVSTRTICWP